MACWDPVIIIDAAGELSPNDRVWGTGGWIPPEQRGVLDWLTLVRLLGWGCSVLRPDQFQPDGDRMEGLRCIIFAGDAADCSGEVLSRLQDVLARHPLLVIAPAGTSGQPLCELAGADLVPEPIEGQAVDWRGPGNEKVWRCRRKVRMEHLAVSGAEVWATLEQRPIIAARCIGPGWLVSLSFLASAARDSAGHFTALLRQLLAYGCPAPVAWLDWDATLILRMDDPGGSQNVWHRDWSHKKLEERDWRGVGEDLRRRQARLSVGYVAGWVDDGDAARGDLLVRHIVPLRQPGAVHPSSTVQYFDRSGHAPGTLHDYTSEYRGIQQLRAAGLAEVELHGYTHLHPDLLAWQEAADRYVATRWFREFGRSTRVFLAGCTTDRHPLAQGLGALREQFGTEAEVLIFPGDEWTNQALERALDLGLQLTSSYYLAIRDKDRFCWCTHVCAPYLDQPDSNWLDAGLPVVGYFHDRDLAIEGIGWLSHWLDAWQGLGFTRLIDFRCLTAALRLRLDATETEAGLAIELAEEQCHPIAHPVVVKINCRSEKMPSTAVLHYGGRPLAVALENHEDGHGSVGVRLQAGRK